MKEVLLVTNYFYPGKRGGGPISSIKNLIDESLEHNNGIKFEILALGKDLGEKNPYKDISLDTKSLYRSIPTTYLSNPYKTLTFIRENRNYDVIHLNSFFNFWFSIVFIISLRLKIISANKVIVSPRGELSKAALNYKNIKKSLFLKLVNLVNLYKEVDWHVTSQEEGNEVQKQLGVLKNNIFFIENCLSSKKDIVLKKKKSNSIKIIFLSRIHPKKNLMYALKVLSSLDIPHVFDIYGPIEDQIYFNDCCSYIEGLKANSMVKYRGELESEEVSKILSNYDLLFFPTQGENFGHVSFESIIAGTPILISNRTPLSGLNKFNIGWDLDLSDLDGFGKKIELIYKMNQEEMMDMQESIKSYIKNSAFFNLKFPHYEEMYFD